MPVAGVVVEGRAGVVAVTGAVGGVAVLEPALFSIAAPGGGAGGSGGGAVMPPSPVATRGPWTVAGLTGAGGFRGALAASAAARFFAASADGLLGSNRGGSVADRT